MRVLMLGWEFPPFITGGLGTACHGLTKALDRRGVRVTFALPKAVDRSHSAHVDLLSPESLTEQTTSASRVGGGPHATAKPVEPTFTKAQTKARLHRRRGFDHADFLHIPSPLLHSYQQSAEDGPVGEMIERAGEVIAGGEAAATGDLPSSELPRMLGRTSKGGGGGTDYAGDLFDQVIDYASFCVQAARHLDFDLVHAHDWMTYPAGLWVARATGRPLVVHIHSTEFDRSGKHVNQPIYDVERRGMHGAMKVVSVSQLTKNTVVSRYSVAPSKVEVVYNGVEIEPKRAGITGIKSDDKIVLYFGRITYQKGPEHFVKAAKRVLEVMPDVKFVIAGSGDLARSTIEMAANLGIGHKVLFTGFLRGDDIPRVFSLADLYVMPSISEPFGIAPLEALSHDVPVLISKTSGVSEVLSHALKVDFWDIDDMADKIIAVLRHPPLKQTLLKHGAFEVRKLTWDGAAERCEQVYRSVLDGMAHRSNAS